MDSGTFSITDIYDFLLGSKNRSGCFGLNFCRCPNLYFVYIKMKMINFKTILILLCSICVFSCSLNDEKKQSAEIIIKKIELFKSNENRFPESVKELGLKEEMDSAVFYEKLNDSAYIVWYGLSVGESNVYRSSSKNWNKEG